MCMCINVWLTSVFNVYSALMSIRTFCPWVFVRWPCSSDHLEIHLWYILGDPTVPDLSDFIPSWWRGPTMSVFMTLHIQWWHLLKVFCCCVVCSVVHHLQSLTVYCWRDYSVTRWLAFLWQWHNALLQFSLQFSGYKWLRPPYMFSDLHSVQWLTVTDSFWLAGPGDLWCWERLLPVISVEMVLIRIVYLFVFGNIVIQRHLTFYLKAHSVTYW